MVKIAVDILRQEKNGRRFADYIFYFNFLKENCTISIHVLLKFVPTSKYISINSDNALVPNRRQAIIRTNDMAYVIMYI